MAQYPYPENVSNLTSWFVYSNTITGGWFVSLFLLAIFCVAFFGLKTYSTHRAFASAGFITLITATIMRILGLIPNIILIASITICAVGVIWLWFAEKQEI